MNFTMKPTYDSGVKISDGIQTYFADCDPEIWDLKEVAELFEDSYDHNEISGEVKCIASYLDGGETYRFTIEA